MHISLEFLDASEIADLAQILAYDIDSFCDDFHDDATPPNHHPAAIRSLCRLIAQLAPNDTDLSDRCKFAIDFLDSEIASFSERHPDIDIPDNYR